MAADQQPGSTRGPFTVAVSLGSIPIEIEPSFWIMGLLLGSSAGLNAALAWTGVLLLSVLLHELGHAVVAMLFGSKVRIRLYSLGGLTYHGRLKRGQAILTSLAGPFAGFLLGGSILLFERFVGVENARLQWLLDMFKWVTLFWGGINLLPVLPLDGGHVLTGVLGEKRIKAALLISTIVAVAAAVVGYAVHFLFASLMFGFLAVRSGLAFNQVGRVEPPPNPTSEDKTGGLERGWAALSTGDDAEAERAAREVLTSTEEVDARNRAFDLLAWVDLARGNANAALRQLARVHPPELARALTKALALEGSGETERALAPALEAHAKEPSEATASLNIRLLTAAGRYDEAEKIAEEYKWPKDGTREASLGGVRHARGDYGMAAKLLQLAFEMRKRPADAFNAACSYARLGDSETALTWLERSVAAGLDDPALLESDPDLEPARQLPGFAAVLSQARAQRSPG